MSAGAAVGAAVGATAARSELGRVFMYGVICGACALAVVLLLDQMSSRSLFREIEQYLKRRDDFERYLQERDPGDATA